MNISDIIFRLSAVGLLLDGCHIDVTHGIFIGQGAKMEDKTTLDTEKSMTSTTGDAQSEISRQILIDKAVKFLENPKVKNSPLVQKRAFLDSKGLTPAEIDLAIASSGTIQDVFNQTSQLPVRQGFHQVNTYPVVVPSFWQRLQDFCTTGVLVCGAFYGLYHLFKKYVLPYLFGIPSETMRLNQMEKQVTEFHATINQSMLQLHETLRDVQTIIQQLNKKQDSIATPQASLGMPKGMEGQFSDLKQEIASLKGLLLNRHQFPATPSITPIIPTWQMASKSEVNAETVVNESESVPVKEINTNENNNDTNAEVSNSVDNVY